MTDTKNFYSLIVKDDSARDNNPNYGKLHSIKEIPFRMLICGGSGTGKTNTLLDLIQRMDKTFVKYVLITKNSNEPLYELLKKNLGKNLEVYEGDILKGKKVCSNIPKMDDVAVAVMVKGKKIYQPVMVIFDDVCLDTDQYQIGQYYTRGRKVGISCAYLSQSYYAVPKSIRLQLTHLILKRTKGLRDLKRIYTEHSTTDNFNDFARIHSSITEKDFSQFLMIDLGNGDMFRNWETKPFQCDEVKDDILVETSGSEKKLKRFVSTNGSVPLNDLENYSTDCFVDVLKTVQPCLLRTRDAFAGYVEYCKQNNLKAGTQNKLSRAMARIFPRKKHSQHGSVWYINMDPNDSYQYYYDD